MVQISNITDLRNNLAGLVSSVAKEKKTIIIIRDSLPEAVLVPYEEYARNEEEQEKLWKLRFENILKKGKIYGRKWAKKNKIPLNKLSEEEIYELVDKI